MPEKEAIGRTTIDNYLVGGIIFAVLYLVLFAAAFMAAFGNPTDTAMMILDIFRITSFTDNILINLVIWFAIGILISLMLGKIRKSML